ncbi:hypothetical protein AB1Y20_005540 [Prymnesium parvum]|uniref:Glutathione transferase n=1 Tax=Prymnesium parvum TaxID=97485 RepID=A0AB34J3M6_PRYPA
MLLGQRSLLAVRLPSFFSVYHTLRAAVSTMATTMLIRVRKLTGYTPPRVWKPRQLPGAWGRECLAALSGKPQRQAELPRGEHALQLYSLGTPNSVKVSILLEELGVEYDAWRVGIFEGEQYTTGFMEVSPNAMVPCLADYSSGEAPVKLFESGAILLHLASKYKRFIPSPVEEEHKYAECLSWLMWQHGSGPYLGVFNTYYFYSEDGEKDRDSIDRWTLEAKRILAVLNTQLEKKETFICGGDEPTVADFAVWPWVRLFIKREKIATFLNLESEYPAIVAWVARLGRRKAVLRGVRVNGFEANAVKERHAKTDFEPEAY